jgi:adenylate cyclase
MVPNFTVTQWAATQPFKYEADRQRFIDGYLLAGLPS